MPFEYRGFPVVEVPEGLLTVPEFRQIKFPKRKNRRIQARWRKNKKNWGMVYVKKAFILRNPFRLVASHDMIDAFVYAMQARKSEQ